MKEQKIITLSSLDGKFYNFFNTPGSIGSLKSHLEEGWRILDMQINKDSQSGWVLLERLKRE